MFRVVQKFTVLDKFKAKYHIAHVEYEDMPEWLDEYVVQCTEQDVRFALDRYAEPLVWRIQLTPEQTLDRIPARICHIHDTCHGWKPSCRNLKANTCELYVAPGEGDEQRLQLTELVNLWRDGYNVVRARS